MSSQLGLFDIQAPKAPRTAALRFFHARDESPSEALEGERRAKGQEAEVLALFRSLPPGTRLTPSDLNAAFPRWPLQSARRALTNLATPRPYQGAPLLRKHPEERRLGPRGARECTWGLR